MTAAIHSSSEQSFGRTAAHSTATISALFRLIAASTASGGGRLHNQIAPSNVIRIRRATVALSVSSAVMSAPAS
jgi:hypothetical protein